MVDPGETTTVALKREFGEEALNTDKHPERAQLIDKIFTNGTLIYQGYVDDPRNTDNAWMETRGTKLSESFIMSVRFLSIIDRLSR